TAADILKGTIATLIPLLASLFIEIEVSRLIIGIFAVLGHTYTIFAKFKGGNVVATYGGIIIGFNTFLLLAVILMIFISFKVYVSSSRFYFLWYYSLRTSISIPSNHTYYFNQFISFKICFFSIYVK